MILHPKNGFTLVELAIVMVIIGLIISGIVGAQSLIEVAERNSLITDLANSQKAIYAFKLQYGERNLPGDFDEATEYWPGQTDNGNGDRRISSRHEAVDFWQHLALAEIWPGDFTGTVGAGTEADPRFKPGENVPIVKMGKEIVIRPSWTTSSLYGISQKFFDS